MKETIQVELNVDRSYFYFTCLKCGMALEDWDAATITHPLKSGLIFKKPIDCVFAGKTFERPRMIFATPEVQPDNAKAER